MPQSKEPRLRKLFRRLTAGFAKAPVRNLSRPSTLMPTSPRPESNGHPIAAERPWLSYRKTDLARPTIAAKLRKLNLAEPGFSGLS